MIRLIILGILLSMFSGSLGAGLAACRNWTGPAAGADTAATAAPVPAPDTAPAPSETDRLWAALVRERTARRAAERRIERMAQPQKTYTQPEPAQPAAPAAPPAAVEPPRNEPVPAPAPPTQPAPQATSITIPAGTAIAVRTATAVSSATARVEDSVSATTTDDVTVDGRTAIPAGNRLLGSVTALERASRMNGSDRIAVRFHTLVYNGVETPFETALVIRNGPGQASQNTTRIGGGAAVGAVLGAIFGGGRGAAIGGAIGAGGGSAAAAAQRAAPAVLEAREALTLRTTRPAAIEAH
ncbi:MAG: TrbI/VirB10 family protein [Acidobacteria bacterium]|nr:TrbI/VirB10 family protein [Acidobacteriota bacterium]